MSQFRQFERPHFFAGKLLSADDLQADQDYIRGKSCLHNRFLHGWGIVTGLNVSADRENVVVSAGLAIDCAGNELVLPEPARITLTHLVGRRYVTIQYLEVPIDQAPSPQGEIEFSRVREAARIELSCANPGAGHAGMGPASPGCGHSHALCLATISYRGAHWRVAPAKRSVLRRK